MAEQQSAGWYADPTRGHELRWWDGEQWTDWVSDGGRTASAPVLPAPAAEKRKSWKRAVLVGGAGFALLLVVAALASPPEAQPSKVQLSDAAGPADDPSTTIEIPTTTVPPATTAAAPPTTSAPATTAAPVVTTAKPAPATTTTARPAPATTAAPVTTAAPATAAPASSGCHPSYEGTCIPPDVSDADCAGGGGNGPHYVYEKNIRVVGRDVYDLDGNDNDGLGCES